LNSISASPAALKALAPDHVNRCELWTFGEQATQRNEIAGADGDGQRDRDRVAVRQRQRGR
jgi:hypothetical protein